MRSVLPLGQWLPDQPALGNPGVTVARNCLPRPNGYGPLASQTVFSPAMAAMARGGLAAKDKAGNAYTYAGTAAKIYSLTAANATSVTNVGGDYALADDSYWAFVKWGEDILALCIDEPVQTLTLGGANFADLGGSPPKARYGAVVRDFVVLGNIDDGTAQPNAVAWCDAGTNTNWSTGQSGEQTLYGEGGWVQGVVGGEYGVIFQEHAIWRMTYEGPPTFFRFDELEHFRGALVPGSIVPVGAITFYLDATGFMVFDGVASRPIGQGRVDRYFFNLLNDSYRHRMSGAADPLNKTVVWAYPSTASAGVPDRLIVYDYGNDKWSEAEVDVQRVMAGLSANIDLDTADAFADDLDAVGAPSLDSRIYTGGALQLSGFSTDHELTVFDGASLAARIETAEAQLNPAGVARLRLARPLADGTATITVGTRGQQNGAVSYVGSYSRNSYTGAVDLRSTARFHRLRLDITGDWSEAQGVEIEALAAGRR